MAHPPHSLTTRARGPRPVWWQPSTTLRFVLAAALLAPVAVVSSVASAPAFAVPNISTVLDAEIVTCETDGTLDNGDPLYYDGTLPLSPNTAIDRSSTLQPAWVGGSNDPDLQYLCNDHIGSLDQGRVGLLVSVNPDSAGDDPTDASPPPVTNVRLQFSVTNARLGSLPSVCGSGSSVSGSGTLATCVIAGPIDSGQVLLAPVTYNADAPTGPAQIDMTLTATATQSQPATEPAGGPLQDPAPATDTHAVTIDSAPTPLNLGINAGQYQPNGGAQTFDDNDDGVPDRVRATSWVSVGPDMLAVGGTGVRAIDLQNFSVTTDPSNGGLYPSATLLDCNGNGQSLGYNTGDFFVQASSPTCTQTSSGGEIDLTLPDGSYWPTFTRNNSAIWVPGEIPTLPNIDRYKDFAAVSVVVEYDAAELRALDNTSSDSDPRVNFVTFCHPAPSATVINAGQPADNNDTDQLACHTVNLTPVANVTRLGNAVGFFGEFEGQIGDAGFAAGLWPAFGSLAQQNLDIVVPGQQMFTGFNVVNRSDGPSAGRYSIPANVAATCTVWDPSALSIAPLDGTLSSVAAAGGRLDDWFAVTTSGSEAPPLSSFTVEFGVIPYSGTSLQPFTCDDAASTWVSDPSTLPAGTTVNAARLVSSEPIPGRTDDDPYQSVRVLLRHQVDPALGDGDRIHAVSSVRQEDGSWRATVASPDTRPDRSLFSTFGSGSFEFGNGGRIDRALVSTAETMVTVDQQGQTPLAPLPTGVDPLSPDPTLDLVAGAETTVEVRPYLRTPLATSETPTIVDNVRAVLVLPPDVQYVDSDLPPTDTYVDCRAALGNDCITNPSLAPDTGWTTLVWNLGAQPSSDTFTALEPISVTTRVSSVLPANSTRTLTTYINRGDRPTVGVSEEFGLRESCLDSAAGADGSAWQGNACFAGRYDNTVVRASNDAALAVDKASLTPVVEGDGEFTHRLGFIHQAGGARDIDLIDVLPYNGDGRLTNDPAGSGAPSSSQFTGTIELASLSVAQGSAVNLGSVWVSSAAPGTLERDPSPADAAGQTIGSATWPCTYPDVLAGAAGCPALDEVTAIRVVAQDVPNAVGQALDVTIQSVGNDSASVFNNDAIARAENLEDLFAQSAIATSLVPCLGVGNLVWSDVDGDGVYTAGTDEPIEGIEVVVRRASDDSVAGTATTDADGRWLVSCLEADDYYLTVDSAELTPLGALVAPGGSIDGLDEDQGHAALSDGVGGAVTDVFTLAVGAAPVQEADPTGLLSSTSPNIRDVDADFTIDLAFEVPSYNVEKVSSVDSTENPATVTPGDVLEYTVTVTNTGPRDYTAAVPASFDDDLSAVLDDASYNGDAAVTGGGTVTFTPATQELSWEGPLAVGDTVEVTYSVTVDNPGAGGNGELVNTVEPTGVGGVCLTADDCVTSSSLQGFTVEKVASATQVNPGESVTYTVTVSNTGAVEYTAGDPAVFTDDMSAVLDDASFNDDASDGASFDDTTGVLTWSGAVPVGGSVTVTYSVTVNAAAELGDGVLTNAVVPDAPGGECADPDDCVTTTDVQAFTVAKTSSATVADPGDTVTYTITVANTGSVAFTDTAPATFTDTLGDVLDDASFNDDASDGASFDDTTGVLTWSGAVPVGGSVTVTYSVTVNTPASGDRVMNNVVVPGASGQCVDAADCDVSTPVRSFAVLKTADVSEVIPGDTVTYTVEVTNTGEADYTALSPASFEDDLAEVLDDATFNDDASDGASFDDTTGVLTWSGAVAVGTTVTVTYSVTVNDPSTGDQVLTNVVVTPSSGNCPEGSTDAACTTASNSGTYTVEKSASAVSALPGDDVTYSLVVTNTGDVDYTGADQATFRDSLSDVLDDATYSGSTSPGVTFDAGTETLTWSGDLAVGESVTVTYTVTVDSPPTGNSILTNTVVPTTPGGLCEVAADCTTTTALQSFTVAKTSTASVANPGDTVTYTVSVTNTGEVAYTDSDRASFTDDLSAVLDDASYNGDASAGASVDDSELSWSGALAVDETITVTYSVTVNDVVDLTDGVLDNVVVPSAPGGLCVDADDCVTSTAVQAYTVVKTSSTSVANPGDTVTYTVLVTNAGQVAYTDTDRASFTDDLSAVLDDASYNGNASAGASVDDSELSWSGALAVGETITVTYSVTVNAAGELGDGVLDNAVVPSEPSGVCVEADDCVTSTDAQAFTVAKTASSAVVGAGGTVEYSVTVVNTGNVAYTAGDPASFTDNLAEVLDDSVYNGDASEGASVDGSTLTWSGPLGVGATATVTYSVTVNGAAELGDAVLDNVVVPTGDGGECVDPDDCVTSTDVQAFTVAKTSSESVVNPGDTVEYTITVTNTGVVEYTEDAPASFTDNLSAVLDDAVYNDDASDGASIDGSVLTWSGALEEDATVTVTYSVTVNAADELTDGVLDNAVVPTATGGDCTDPDDCTTSTDVQAFTVEKVSSASVVDPGDTLTYTIEVVNTGGVDFTEVNPAEFTDDLSGVLDDAVYNDDASLGGAYVEPFIAWAVSVDSGDTVTVTYSVTVSAAGSGDGRMVNAVVPDEEIGGGCAAEDACATDTPVRSYTAVKTVDAAAASAGQVLRYDIVITNTGEADYTLESPAGIVDDLSDVLEEGAYGNDATNGAVYVAPELTWRGALAVGESVTVSFTVQLNDRVTASTDLVNTVFTTTGGNCPVPDDFSLGRGAFSGGVHSASSVTVASALEMPEDCVAITTTGELASTGSSELTVPLVASGVLAVMVGLGLVLIRRRRDTVES